MPPGGSLSRPIKDDVEAEHMRNRDILIEKGLFEPVYPYTYPIT